MKPAFSSIIGSLLLLTAIASCTKEDSPPQPDFFVRATKDRASWTAAGSGTFSKSRKQFYVFGQVGDAAQAEILNLSFALPAAPQLTPVQALSASWVTVVGGDVISNSYGLTDTPGVPALEITRLDTVSKVVEGRFTATLVRDKHWSAQQETVQFTDGSFRVQYTTAP
ncbi:hypothetical protein [Hymenobacter sp. DG01]|uniref:hypothetical protein n=1 Tax=Hymenobacter sp. DG01 TaxID=2584940 RepID=UPI00111D904A|nr:hypothetical protein [Hymenobacter sp. DG01]